jgi:phosphopantetheine--protein transferase-like protein
MDESPSFKKIIDTIKKEEFIRFFSSCEPEKCFSKKELLTFSLSNNMRSLGGRYLIKRTICNHIHDEDLMFEIEILNNELGKPEIFLGENILKKTQIAGIKEVQCSISHSKNFIAGMTILSF